MKLAGRRLEDEMSFETVVNIHFERKPENYLLESLHKPLLICCIHKITSIIFKKVFN